MAKEEVDHLRRLNNASARAELTGLTPEQAARLGKAEELVFSTKGEHKGKMLKGGESKLVELGDVPGTPTYIEYINKHGQKAATATIISDDKKLLTNDGRIIRELY